MPGSVPRAGSHCGQAHLQLQHPQLLRVPLPAGQAQRGQQLLTGLAALHLRLQQGHQRAGVRVITCHAALLCIACCTALALLAASPAQRAAWSEQQLLTYNPVS